MWLNQIKILMLKLCDVMYLKKLIYKFIIVLVFVQLLLFKLNQSWAKKNLKNHKLCNEIIEHKNIDYLSWLSGQIENIPELILKISNPCNLLIKRSS